MREKWEMRKGNEKEGGERRFSINSVDVYVVDEFVWRDGATVRRYRGNELAHHLSHNSEREKRVYLPRFVNTKLPPTPCVCHYQQYFTTERKREKMCQEKGTLS